MEDGGWIESCLLECMHKWVCLQGMRVCSVEPFSE